MNNDVTVEATVWEIALDPERRDPRRPYLVRLRIQEVLEGNLSQDRVSLLIADVRRTFRDPNPVGASYLITMAGPITEPYSGQLEVTPSENDLDAD